MRWTLDRPRWQPSAKQKRESRVTNSCPKVTHAFFGIQTVPIPPAAAAQAGVPEGLFVQAVTPGGPAATAGLRADDVITTIDGQPATSNIQLQELS